jgi:hypothetical protein
MDAKEATGRVRIEFVKGDTNGHGTSNSDSIDDVVGKVERVEVEPESIWTEFPCETIAFVVDKFFALSVRGRFAT